MVTVPAYNEPPDMVIETLDALARLDYSNFEVLVIDNNTRWDGWAMCVGSGLAVLLLNWLFRMGAKGDEERDAEESAREYLGTHGHWPDERPLATEGRPGGRCPRT